MPKTLDHIGDEQQPGDHCDCGYWSFAEGATDQHRGRLYTCRNHSNSRVYVRPS